MLNISNINIIIIETERVFGCVFCDNKNKRIILNESKSGDIPHFRLCYLIPPNPVVKFNSEIWNQDTITSLEW